MGKTRISKSVGPDGPTAPNVKQQIRAHMAELRKSLLTVTACTARLSKAHSDPFDACGPWWGRAEDGWRRAYASAEEALLLEHAHRWHEYVPQSNLTVGDIVDFKSNYGSTSPLDYWEPLWPCADDSRVPAGTVGDGPKWLCGASSLPQPCRVVSLGSNLDDRFERGMYGIANCTSLIVDPTMGGKAQPFAAKLATIGGHLNASVGIGVDGGAGASKMAKGRSFATVSVQRLLREHYGHDGPLHLSVLKVDIEGFEYAGLQSVWDMCTRGQLTVDALLVEVHIRRAHVVQLYELFSKAYSCGLVLSHKERNNWGCWKGHCVEYAWVSLRHAHRLAAAQAHQTVAAYSAHAPRPLKP